jgi:hypothetical protein
MVNSSVPTANWGSLSQEVNARHVIRAITEIRAISGAYIGALHISTQILSIVLSNPQSHEDQTTPSSREKKFTLKSMTKGSSAKLGRGRHLKKFVEGTVCMLIGKASRLSTHFYTNFNSVYGSRDCNIDRC